MATAIMGYFGQATFTGLPSDNIGGSLLPRNESAIRATDISLTMSQAVEKPALIDSRFDYTAYQLQPREVGGGITFPAFHSATNNTSSAGIVGSIWRAGMERDSTNGRMTYSFDSHVKYANSVAHSYGGSGTNVAFKYTDCQINTMELSVSQEDVLNVNLDLIGIDRVEENEVSLSYPSRNSRIVTWNDVVAAFHISDPVGQRVGLVKGDVLRSISLNVNNNVQRFYTLNNLLIPEDITATKREITGSATALGRIFNIARMARTNEQRCSEFSQIIFGFRAAGSGSFITDDDQNNYSDGNCPSGNSGTYTDPTTGKIYDTCGFDCSGGFFVYFPGVVFEIEELGLTTDIFETNFNFHVLPGAQQTSFNNEAGFLLGSGGSINPNTFQYTGTIPTSWFVNPSGGTTTAT